ncbi:MAG TPA: MarC family protein, partial [Thermoplasmata archaeon]|nr:MarC family protein [Thermoplasmata archaeon]
DSMAFEFLIVFIPMFIVIDPFGVMPIYLVLTKSMTPEQRSETLKYAITFGASLLVAFALLGKVILDYLSVSIDALRISGGLLLLVIGVMMLYEGDTPRSRRKGAEEPEEEPHMPEDVAFVPLGTPMLAGPGAISVVITLTGTADMSWVLLSLAAVMVITTLMLWKVDLVFKVIGNAGTRALTRVMGLITSAYAVQMILDGITGYVASI